MGYVMAIDRTLKEVPIAEIKVDTPYYQGCGSGYFSNASASTPIASASVSTASASTNKK